MNATDHKLQRRSRWRACSVFLVWALFALLATTGCARWGTQKVFGRRQEVARRMVGAPQVAETTSSELTAGFAGARGKNSVAGGLAGSHDSMKRTHCVQQAEVDYVQPYELVPAVEGRGLDIAAGSILGVLGLSVLLSTPEQTTGEPGTPGPPQTGRYVLGGSLIAAGVGWLTYSYGWRPPGPTPAVQTARRSWTEVSFVESTGCGLVPSDTTGRPAPALNSAIDERLHKLDELRKSGTITEEEYRQKRKAILDTL